MSNETEKKISVLLTELASGTLTQQEVQRSMESLFNDPEALLPAIKTVYGPGAAAICKERLRQQTEEGWTDSHDDHHLSGELADAAACYAAGEPIFREVRGGSPRLPAVKFENVWPFEHRWYKPKDDTGRNLAMSGALSAAEYDRLIRRKEIEDNDYMCQDCEQIIPEEEWEMFDGRCEECAMDQEG